MKELDVVVLTKDYPAEGLAAGRRGTIVDLPIHSPPREWCVVEFPGPSGGGEDDGVLADIRIADLSLAPAEGRGHVAAE
ncbi:MAG: DUF4926 domain-containing protein [Caulobacterales bacterium]|jgi:hypothetical protein